MEDSRKEIKQYSESFKLKVISEIESGQLSKEAAKKLYGIGGHTTIYRWIKKLGKNHLLGKVVRIEAMGEIERLKQLEKEKKELESALAQAQLKIISLEKLIEVASREMGVDIKKNTNIKQSKNS